MSTNMFAVTNHSLATSALPNAPVEPDQPRVRRHRLRTGTAAALRSVAVASHRLAQRLERRAGGVSAA